MTAFNYRILAQIPRFDTWFFLFVFFALRCLFSPHSLGSIVSNYWRCFALKPPKQPHFEPVSGGSIPAVSPRIFEKCSKKRHNHPLPLLFPLPPFFVPRCFGIPIARKPKNAPAGAFERLSTTSCCRAPLNTLHRGRYCPKKQRPPSLAVAGISGNIFDQVFRSMVQLGIIDVEIIRTCGSLDVEPGGCQCPAPGDRCGSRKLGPAGGTDRRGGQVDIGG
jgi:hypothetical protein